VWSCTIREPRATGSEKDAIERAEGGVARCDLGLGRVRVLCICGGKCRWEHHSDRSSGPKAAARCDLGSGRGLCVGARGETLHGSVTHTRREADDSRGPKLQRHIFIACRSSWGRWAPMVRSIMQSARNNVNQPDDEINPTQVSESDYIALL
jgi:hypothetical protein